MRVFVFLMICSLTACKYKKEPVRTELLTVLLTHQEACQSAGISYTNCYKAKWSDGNVWSAGEVSSSNNEGLASVTELDKSIQPEHIIVFFSSDDEKMWSSLVQVFTKLGCKEPLKLDEDKALLFMINLFKLNQNGDNEIIYKELKDIIGSSLPLELKIDRSDVGPMVHFSIDGDNYVDGFLIILCIIIVSVIICVFSWMFIFRDRQAGPVSGDIIKYDAGLEQSAELKAVYALEDKINAIESHRRRASGLYIDAGCQFLDQNVAQLRGDKAIQLWLLHLAALFSAEHIGAEDIERKNWRERERKIKDYFEDLVRSDTPNSSHFSVNDLPLNDFIRSMMMNFPNPFHENENQEERLMETKATKSAVMDNLLIIKTMLDRVEAKIEPINGNIKVLLEEMDQMTSSEINVRELSTQAPSWIARVMANRGLNIADFDRLASKPWLQWEFQRGELKTIFQESINEIWSKTARTSSDLNQFAYWLLKKCQLESLGKLLFWNNAFDRLLSSSDPREFMREWLFSSPDGKIDSLASIRFSLMHHLCPLFDRIPDHIIFRLLSVIEQIWRLVHQASMELGVVFHQVSPQTDLVNGYQHVEKAERVPSVLDELLKSTYADHFAKWMMDTVAPRGSGNSDRVVWLVQLGFHEASRKGTPTQVITYHQIEPFMAKIRTL